MASTASICTIKEILPGGGIGEVFVWTSDDTPAGGQSGGARAAWVAPWTFGIKQRQIRTDFPGTKKPSRQVLGSSRKPFTMTGKFDDRYNYVGYAEAEVRRLEELVERGNLVEVSHAKQAFVGLITEIDFPYRREWEIGYAISFDPDKRKDDARQDNASPFTVEKPLQSVDDLTVMSDAMAEAHAKRPQGLLAGTISGANTALQKFDEDLQSMQTAVAGVTGKGSTLGEMSRLATKCQNIQGDCADIVNALVNVRSDVEVGVTTAKTVLQLDVWAKTMAVLARLAMGRAYRARRGLAERQTPATKRYYRPRKGQSLYEISRECYGTPMGHRAIAQANHLHGLTLEGTEVLVIPER
jgi:hypothetical protein